MPVTVVVDRHVQLRPRRPHPVVQPVEHAGAKLRAVQLRDQRRAVIPVKARPALIRSVEPHPRPPPGGADVSDRFGRRGVLIAPLIAAQPRQLVGDDGALQPAGGIGFGERQITTTCAVHARDRAQRVDPVGRRLDHLDNVGVPIRSVIADDTNLDSLIRQRVPHEHDPALMARNAAAPVGRWPGGERQFRRPRRRLGDLFTQSRKPLRASPGAACGCSVLSRSEELNCHGTDVTITFGMNSSLPFSRSALWLWSTCSHQCPTTYSGMNTVTTVRGDSLLIRLTYSSTGRVISRYGDAITLSGTVISLSSHLCTSSRVSPSSTLTVIASSTSGRVARAYASARSVGRCILDTSTMAWLRLGKTMSR